MVREEGKVQLLVYYVSKKLLDVETRYPQLKKIALTFIVAPKKLRPYFHAHSIEVLTKYSLC